MDRSPRITYTLKLAILIVCLFKNDGINSQLIDYQKVGHFTKDSLKEIWIIKKRWDFFPIKNLSRINFIA